MLLNDGAIPTQTADGSFQVDQVYDVSGTVPFWNGGVVSGALLTLTGDRVYTGLSDATGAYTVGGAAADDYVLTPSKSDEANGISAYDASLALQHDAGLIVLSGHAASAADVNRSGTITSMDAFHIVQKSVDLIALPFPGAGVVWSFAPPSRSYANLSSNQTGQDFTAVLLGDVSGNWSPTPPPAPPEQPAGSATLSLSDALAAPGERITDHPLDRSHSGPALCCGSGCDLRPRRADLCVGSTWRCGQRLHDRSQLQRARQGVVSAGGRVSLDRRGRAVQFGL